MSRPYDKIVTGVLERAVVPVATYLGDPPSFDGEMRISRYVDWKPQRALPYKASDLKGFVPFEQIAIDAVNDYLSGKRNAASSSPTLAQLDAAGKVLDAVLNWHRSARQRGTRIGDGWERFEKDLSDKLRDVLLQELKLYVYRKQWEPAYGLSARLSENYPKDKQVQAAALEFLASQAQDFADKADASNRNDEWRKVAEVWRGLRQQFPESPAVRNIAPRLESKARSLKELADKEQKAGHKSTAVELFATPRVSGLSSTGCMMR